MVMVIERMKVEDGVKIKDAEIIDTVNYIYIVDDYEDLINIYMYGLKKAKICMLQVWIIRSA